jgi:hypothetical protein
MQKRVIFYPYCINGLKGWYYEKVDEIMPLVVGLGTN